MAKRGRPTTDKRCEDEEDLEDTESEEEEDDEDEDGDSGEEDEEDEEEEDEDEDGDSEDEDGEDDGKDEGVDTQDGPESWAFTGKAARKRMAQHRALAAGQYKPSFWIREGDTKPKYVRFITTEPTLVFQHVVPALRKGKRVFPGFTCSGKSSCPFCEAGVSVAAKQVYIVNDFTPFTDRAGKTHRVSQKFWEMSEARHKSAKSLLAEVKNPKRQIVKVKREGEGTKTLYSMYPKRTRDLSPEEKALKPLLARFKNFYAPLARKDALRAIRASSSASAEMDGD